MPEPELLQPPKVEELPAPLSGAATPPPAVAGPLYFPDEPESSGSWLGALLVLIILFYFFAPVGWKAWVQEQWEKLPVEVSVKVKKLPTNTVTPPQPLQPPPSETTPTTSPLSIPPAE